MSNKTGEGMFSSPVCIIKAVRWDQSIFADAYPIATTCPF